VLQCDIHVKLYKVRNNVQPISAQITISTSVTMSKKSNFFGVIAVSNELRPKF